MEKVDFEYLSQATLRIAEAQRIRRERDARIASLVRYKRGSVHDIQRATGLTKSRIYQIVESNK